MAEAAFSEDGKYYSAISQDGRLKIWDTEKNVLNQEYTPDNHLTNPPCCLQWLSVNATYTPGKGNCYSITSQEIKCIAFGTTDGRILIYSVVEAKIKRILTAQQNKDKIVRDIHNRKIQSLDWHRKYGLFSCTSNNVVVEWDLDTSLMKHKYDISVKTKNKQGNTISAIKIIPHTQNTTSKFLVAASWQLRLWRLDESEAILIKCFGHNASPKALLTLATINNLCWLIEGSQTERLLSFWDVTITNDALPQQNGEEETPSKRPKRKSTNLPTVPTPTYNFVLEDAPSVIDARLKTEENMIRLDLAACTRSGVIHYYGHTLNGATTKPIKPSVTIHVTTPDATPLHLQCCRLPSKGDLILGFANGTMMLFENVVPDLNTKTQVLIRGESREGKRRQSEVNDVNKVKPEKVSNAVTYVEPMGGVPNRKRMTPGGKVEVSMESRLENLSIDLKSRNKSAVNQNFTKLLMQGLHSKDKGLILTVLQQDDPAVAERTVSALPADYVPLLFEQLADMATRKTSQCGAAGTWARAAARAHAALLLAGGARAGEPLARLLAVLTHRRSHLCQLLNLKGRIDLTLAQKTDSRTDVVCEPLLTYKDSSDEDMEVERYQSESDQSWDDDEEAGDEGPMGDGDPSDPDHSD